MLANPSAAKKLFVKLDKQGLNLWYGFERAALEHLAEEAGFRQIRFATVFTIAKGTPEREYPVFLMIARRP